MSLDNFTAQMIAVFLAETAKNIAKGSANITISRAKELFHSEIIELNLNDSINAEEITKRLEENPRILESAQKKLIANPKIIEEIVEQPKSENTYRDNGVQLNPAPKIEIMWDKANSKYLKSTGEKIGERFITQKVYIGIKNLTNQSIDGLRVQIEHLYVQAFEIQLNEHIIPLREKNDTSPYKESFTLNPESKLLFYVGECSGDSRTFKIFQAMPDSQPFELPYASSFTIIADGNEILPCKKLMHFMWKHEGLMSP